MNERHRFNALKDEHAAATSEQPSPERETAQPPASNPAPELTNHEKIDLKYDNELAAKRAHAERFPDHRATQDDYHYYIKRNDNERAMAHEKEERLQRALMRPSQRDESEHALESDAERDGSSRERE